MRTTCCRGKSRWCSLWPGGVGAGCGTGALGWGGHSCWWKKRLLKPPGNSNNHGKMHPSPQKEGHAPWEEPRWLQPLPELESLLGLLVCVGCDHWAGHWNCWDLHCFSYGDCGGSRCTVGILATRAPELPAKTGPSLPASLSSIPCCPRLGAPGPMTGVLVDPGIVRLSRQLMSLLWQHPEYRPTKTDYC